MRAICILFGVLGLSGCATQKFSGDGPSHPSVTAPVVPMAAATHAVETRYDLRAYRDADDPAVRHEGHAVYRTTMVPADVDSLETDPREKFAPLSYAPLPASDELAAEISAQKEITTRLRTIEANMATLQEKAQKQYGTLATAAAAAVQTGQVAKRESLDGAAGNAGPVPSVPQTNPAVNW